MTQGWIKLHRKLLKWEWYHDSKMVHLFIYLLLSANHEPGRWRGIEIDRGQLVTGLHSLQKGTNLSIQTIRTCLSKLKKTQELTIQSTNRFSLITLCNYEDYQSNCDEANSPANKQLTNKQQTTNKQLTTNKNVKNEKNDKKTNSIFEESRKLYPGDKRGSETEFTYFTKTHKDWRDVLPLLKPAIEQQILWRKNANGEFRPAWKQFKSWIFNRIWELEVALGSQQPQICIIDKKPATKFQMDATGKKLFLCDDCLVAFKRTGRSAFGRMPSTEIERAVLDGKAKR